MKPVKICRQEDLYILWQETEDGNARVVRAFGGSPQFCLPDMVEESRITEIAPYCFSQNRHFRREDISGSGINCISEDYRELCGEYVEKIVLPEGVTKIGNLAFYNCRNLVELNIGCRLCDYGSDVFMNCSRLHSIIIRCGELEISGAKQLLSRISSEIEIVFMREKEVRARLLYPEYFELYDEIAPAHIFGCSVTGEGFRARQCFNQGVVDYERYDDVFGKAAVTEGKSTLCRFALNRLMYPVKLSNIHRKEYTEYLSEHEKILMEVMINERNLPALECIISNKIVTEQTVEMAVLYATERNWSEGAVSIMQWKHLYYHSVKTAKKRYEF